MSGGDYLVCALVSEIDPQTLRELQDFAGGRRCARCCGPVAMSAEGNDLLTRRPDLIVVCVPCMETMASDAARESWLRRHSN